MCTYFSQFFQLYHLQFSNSSFCVIFQANLVSRSCFHHRLRSLEFFPTNSLIKAVINRLAGSWLRTPKISSQIGKPPHSYMMFLQGASFLMHYNLRLTWQQIQPHLSSQPHHLGCLSVHYPDLPSYLSFFGNFGAAWWDTILLKQPLFGVVSHSSRLAHKLLKPSMIHPVILSQM